MRITTAEYILIAVGIFTLTMVVGFIILGVVAWRIGTRMEKEGQEEETNSANALCSCPECTQNMDMMEQQSTSMKSESREAFKLEDYSDITLENGK